MIGQSANGPACADHVELYDQIADLGDQAPMVLSTRALHLCDGCSRTLACRDGAVDRGEQWGMWGGVVMTPPAERTLDQRLGLRAGSEIGDLVEALDSKDLAGEPEVRTAALERLYEEVEAEAMRPAFRTVTFPQEPSKAVRRHRDVPERVWIAAMRSGVGARRIADERAPVP